MTAGRPDKLTPNMHKNIINAVKSGASDTMAADLVGLANITIHRWSQRGQEHRDAGIESKYVNFCTDYKRAKAERDIKLVQYVEAEASINWTAAMRLLEARRASEFSRSANPRDPFELKTSDRDTFISQILQMVADNHISSDEGVKLAKIKLDSDNTEFRTELLDRVKALEVER